MFQLAEGSTYLDRMVGFPVKNSTDYIADIDVEEIDFDKSDDANDIETQDCSDSVSFFYDSAKQFSIFNLFFKVGFKMCKLFCSLFFKP